MLIPEAQKTHEILKARIPPSIWTKAEQNMTECNLETGEAIICRLDSGK